MKRPPETVAFLCQNILIQVVLVWNDQFQKFPVFNHAFLLVIDIAHHDSGDRIALADLKRHLDLDQPVLDGPPHTFSRFLCDVRNKGPSTILETISRKAYGV